MATSLLPRRVLAAAAVAALACGLAGCSSASAAPATGAVSFAVGGRSNMPPIQLDGRAMAVLDEAVENQSLASIVVADGDPSVVASSRLKTEGENETAREQSRQRNRQALADGLVAAAADDPQADLLTALDLAARSIRSETGPHTIVVVDSGLSTVAPLDFTQPGMLEADPQEVVDQLRNAGALPELDGTVVVLQGIGDTAEPQERLSIAQRASLLATWEAVIKAAGASSVDFEDAPLEGEPEEDLPDVSPVPLPLPYICTPGRVELGGGDVAFEADTAVFRDAQAAEAVIAPIAEQMVAGGMTARVTGTTADVGEIDGQLVLSRDRAQAVADVLADLGVQPGDLTVEGLGSDFPEYVPDHDANGDLIPGAAAQNRKVTITLSGTISCS